jgi:hypothetical protein
MSQTTKNTTLTGKYGPATASYSSTTTQGTFPYGCQWGCGRQNVVSQPGNSCGRAACNDARSAKSLGGGRLSTHATNK